MSIEAIKPVLDIEGPLHVVCKCPDCKEAQKNELYLNKAYRLADELRNHLSVAPYSDIVSDGGFDPRNQFDTTPQQRTWVGLTDDEVYEIYLSVQEKVNEHWDNGGTTMMFPITLYKAIEAKLKDKNI